MKTMKKAMSILLALVMLIAMLPTGVFAAYQDEFVDFPTGWSKVAMEAAVDNGLLNGFTDGTIKPQANLTRAEMAAIITRAFNAKTKSDISNFADVNPSAWYYDYIAKAVKMGALNGKSSTMMYPDTPITREEVFTAVARVLVLSSENTSALNRYPDKENISSWASNSMCALAERSYVNGDEFGNANPKANITREEFAQFMYNTIRTYITKEGTYTKDLEGITVLRVGNVILEGLNNTSDLVIGDGVGEDSVRITNVNVEKRLLARGGKITLQNTTVAEGVVVNNVNGITYFNNYRTEKVFDGIIENTEARFKERESSGGTVVPPATRYEVTFIVDGESTTVRIKEGAAIGSKMPADRTRPGYTFAWVDEHGNPVTAETIVNGDMTVYGIFTPNTYNITYEFEAGAGFAPGYLAPATYGPADTTDILPKAENIAPATGRYFLYWIDKATGEQLTSLPLYETNGATLALEAVFDDVPPTYYTVRFFDGYPQDEDYLLGELNNVVAGSKVASGDIPAIDEYDYRTGHKKNSSIASVYTTDYEHPIRPTYWYVDDTNKLVPFTSNVKIVKDTDVYLLYKNLTTFMSIDGQSFSVTASYEHSTRLLNSMKDMAWGARSQLELALELDVISGLDEKALDKLVAANILDGSKNIKKLNLPIAIGKVVKRDTVNGSIKQFIRDTINNDAKLDSILDMIDIDQFIADININQMVKDMTDEELRDLIKSDSYKGDVIDFVLDDLEKDDSKMLDAVVNHILNDPTYKNDLIEEIIAKLKLGTAEDSIIESIKDSDNLLNMVIEALQNKDTTLMPSAVSHIKGTLSANTPEGSSLRNTVLTSNKLKDILMQNAIKAKLLDMMTDVEFINKAMENHDFRVEMVKAIVENHHFLEMLVGTDMFTEYVVDNLHHGELKDDVLSLLESESEFKHNIIAEIKTNDTFLGLIKKGTGGQPDGVLRADVLAEIKFTDFVENQDNFVAYILGQLTDTDLTTAQSKYSFITQTQIEDILEAVYEDYEEAADKQAFKDYIYNNEYASAKAEIITQAQAKFNEYKEDTVDKLANKQTITDEKVNETINELLVEHTTKYINEDPSLNATEKQAIEDVLVHYVGDVLCDETITSTDENADVKAHIDALKLQLLEDDDYKDDVIGLIDDFIAEERDTAKEIIGEETTYAQVVDKLVTLVNAEGSTVYPDVDKMLMDNVASVSDTLIEDFVAQNAGNADLKSSIQSYISGMANTTIATHIMNFMTDATIVEGGTESKGEVNTAKVRTEINNYLTADKIREYAEDFVKDPDNAEELEEEVTNFVENISVQFVTDNRITIEDALTDMDLSGLVDKDTVKEHIAGLTPEEKQNFADKIYNTLIKTDDVKTFIESLLNDETFDITEDNLSIIKAIAEALRGFEYEDVMAEINNETLNKVIDIVGEDFIKDQFNTIIGDYCDGLDEVIAQVEADNVTRQYTTSLTVVIDIINDIYKPLYDKAQSKVEDKIQDVYGIDFTENPYIKFLVEDDITARLFDGDSSLATDELTGYAIKDVIDYYDYFYMLLLVGDDAACWFGENVSDERIDAIYEAMIGKMLSAHGKLNEIIETYLEEDELPAQAESILNSVQQLNDAFMKIEPTLKKVFDKYLTSGINMTLEDGIVPGEEKGDKLIDFIIGKDDPVVNIDTIYNVFYYYDDSIQDKLAEVVESDKFKAAVEKFESSSIGQKILGNEKIQGAYDSVYDLFVDIAKDGIEQFRIEKDVITTEDAYRVKVGGAEIIIKRFYEK